MLLTIREETLCEGGDLYMRRKEVGNVEVFFGPSQPDSDAPDAVSDKEERRKDVFKKDKLHKNSHR